MRLISRLMLVLVALAIPATASSASEKLHTLGTGDVTIDNGAVLLANDPGEYSGVYIRSWLREGGFKSLSEITTASFKVEGYVGAGSPRISLPLDVDGNGTTDGWAYLSAFYCAGVDGVGVDTADFTSSPASCTIYTSLDGVGYAGLAGLQAAYPTARVARNNATFVILDETGSSTISDLQIE